MSNDMDARIARANRLHIYIETGWWAWLERTAQLSDRIHLGGNYNHINNFQNKSKKNQTHCE